MSFGLFFVYGIILFLCAVYDFQSNNKKIKKFLFLCILFSFSIFAMSRGFDVPDTEVYAKYFNLIKGFIHKEGFFTRHGQYEIGFELLNKIIAFFNLSYRWLFFIIAFINTLLVSSAFKNKRYVLLPVIIFISFFGYYFCFIILRAGLSVCLFLYAVMKYRAKPFKQILLFILSFSFHASVILGIFLYIVCMTGKKRHLNFSVTTLIVVVAFIWYYFGISRFLIPPVLKMISSLDTDNRLLIRLFLYIENFKIIPYQISFRYLLNILVFIYVKWIFAKTACRNYYREYRTLYLYQRLIFSGILIVAVLGNDVLIGRMCDFLFIFNCINYLLAVDYSQQKVVKSTQKRYIAFNYILNLLIVLVILIAANMFFFYRIIG